MELNKAKAILHKLLKEPKPKIEEYQKYYADGILDFFNEVTREATSTQNQTKQAYTTLYPPKDIHNLNKLT